MFPIFELTLLIHRGKKLVIGGHDNIMFYCWVPLESGMAHGMSLRLPFRLFGKLV